MKIVELFSSIDGEGIRTGKLVTFIRTYGCDLRCSYCDSMYAVDETVDLFGNKNLFLSNKIFNFAGTKVVQKMDFDTWKCSKIV